MDDAEIAIVVMSSAAGTGKDAVDELRAEGKGIGLLKPAFFGPFPMSESPRLEEDEGRGGPGPIILAGAFGAPLFTEIRSALYDYEKRPSWSTMSMAWRPGYQGEHFKEVAASWSESPPIPARWKKCLATST